MVYGVVGRGKRGWLSERVWGDVVVVGLLGRN
jgi:hypothetical protein